MTGASLVFPGARLDSASLVELLVAEKVTMSGGVPTVWQSILAQLAATGQRLPHLKRVYIGGSACSRAMLETLRNEHGVEVRAGFGMTEMGPMSAVGSLMPETAGLPPEQEIAVRQTQVRPPYLVACPGSCRRTASSPKFCDAGRTSKTRCLNPSPSMRSTCSP